jgi:hypothetical protein
MNQSINQSNNQSKILICIGCGPLQGIFNVHGVWHCLYTGTHYGLRSGFPIMTRLPLNKRASPYPPPGDALGSPVGSSPWGRYVRLNFPSLLTPFSVAVKTRYPGLTTLLTFYNCLYSLTCSRLEYSWNTAHWTLNSYMECGIVYTRVPIMVHDQAFLLWPDYPSTRGLPPIRHPGTRWAALWDRTLVTYEITLYNACTL